jgi:tetratricopeptide (TPR) repeat protein
VTAQLINVADGYHLWADEYDRELRDVFRVQDELARAIVGALRVPLKLSDRLDSALVKVGTADPEAHDLYLQGRIFWNQRTYESLLTAVRYFERALARDSAYAEAYAALADAYVVFPDYGVSVPREAYPRAKTAAMRALALDSTLGYAHATLGVVRETYEWDWNGAEQEFRRAIALDPSYATAHQWYAEYLSSLGRLEEALAEAERAVTLDPLSRIIRVDKADVLLGSRRYDEAIAELRETLALDPDFVQAHIILGQTYLAKGMLAEAVTELETVARLSGRHAGLGRLACAYALSGQRDKARELIRELTERSRHEYVSPYHFAIAYACLGDKEQALAWLERMADTREPSVPSLGTDPYWDPLRSDPRFTRLLKRVGLQ